MGSTSVFFENGTHAQFEYVLSQYQEALELKARSKSSKPDTLIKLDKWYQNELPKKIKSRGKDPHLIHDELVQTIKWKLARGVFRPRLKDLVQMNTPRVVMQETKKAFRHLTKKRDLEAAVQAMSNLKGVGPAMASAVLAAGAPEIAPFMADECLLAMPGMEGIDYTMKEYMKLVEKTKECVERLNSQGGEWTPHKVELAVWTHYVCRDLKPELLDGLPGSNVGARLNGKSSVNGVAENGDATPAVVANGDSEGDKTHETSQQPADVAAPVNTLEKAEEKDAAVAPTTTTENGSAPAATVPPPTANHESSTPPPTEEGASDASPAEDKQDDESKDETPTEAETVAPPPQSVNGTAPTTNGGGPAVSEEAEPEKAEESTASNNGELTQKGEVAKEETTPMETTESVAEAAANGSAAPVEEEETTTTTPAVKAMNGSAEPEKNGTSEKVVAGEAEKVVCNNGEMAKEASAQDLSCESQKRSLEEDEEKLQSEPKRIKDDLAVPPAIPAGGE